MTLLLQTVYDMPPWPHAGSCSTQPGQASQAGGDRASSTNTLRGRQPARPCKRCADPRPKRGEYTSSSARRTFAGRGGALLGRGLASRRRNGSAAVGARTRVGCMSYRIARPRAGARVGARVARRAWEERHVRISLRLSWVRHSAKGGDIWQADFVVDGQTQS
jgi:hypothetical protein